MIVLARPRHSFFLGLSSVALRALQSQQAKVPDPIAAWMGVEPKALTFTSTAFGGVNNYRR